MKIKTPLFHNDHNRPGLVINTLLVTPAFLLTLVVMLLPLLLMARYSANLFVPGQFMVDDFSLINYVNVATDPFYRRVLLTTVAMSVAVTVFSLVFGIPLAHFISKARAWKKTLILLVIIPLFVGNAVRAAGWMLAFGQQGLVNGVLTALGFIDQPLQIMFTPWAVLIGCVAVNTPYVVLTVQSVLESLNPSVEEAALSLGATPFQTFMKATLPQAMPGIKAATVLSFILAMNAYATPVLLGGPGFHMMAPALTSEIMNKNNWPVGATLSIVLVVTTLVLTWAVGRPSRRASQ